MHTFIKMKQKLFNEIEIPEGVDVEISEENTVKVKGPEGETSRDFRIRKLELRKSEDGKKIIIGHDKATKREKALMNSITAHIRNMLLGVGKKWEYQLKAVSSHFPMTLENKGNEIVVNNFLGEKIPRRSKILDGVEVEIQKETIFVRSVNIEKAGQTAANLESATRISNRDRRVFQDGIFITHKTGEEI